MTQDLSILYLEAAKILTYAALSFLIAMWWAPFLIALLRWLKFWKKKSRTVDMSGKELEVTKNFYKEDEAKVQVPRAGGILIWATAIGFALVFWFVMKLATNPTTQFLNFIDRRQTFIPLGTLFFAAIAGFIDDALSTLEDGGNYFAGGLKLSHRFGFVTILSIIIGLWFVFRLDMSSISLGFIKLDLSNVTWVGEIMQFLFGGLFDFLSNYVGWFGTLNLYNTSWLLIPILVVVMLTLWGSSVIDGYDGLAAGVFIPVYLCFAGLSFTRGFYDIATLLMVLVGALAAYLWFNIPPAKFYMGDTGTMPLLLTLGVVAFLIDAIYVLPIAGLVLLATVGSNVIQIFSKKFFGRKVFLAAPLHHHFEAAGWLRHQVTMRYWLISIMTSVLGLAVGLLLR